jgi:hypothetical protein
MRDRLIFGSHALKHHFPDFKREPKDLDIITKDPLMTPDEQHYWIPEFQYFLDNNKDDTYLDADHLITLKLSHGGWDIHWEKTMGDILFLKSKGCKVDKKLYKRLVKDWIKVHGKKWASLKGKDSTTFFEDAVPRKYNHDSIHEAIAIYDRPLYERLIVDGVTCGEDAFNLLSHEDKLNLVREEVWTTALERFLIPSNFTCGDTAAYSKSLKKLATTMSSGYFKFFILDNFDQLWQNKDKSYIKRFKEAEQQNKLRTV